VAPDRETSAEALADAARRERSLLVGLSYRITGSWEDAEEVVQETFARAIERPPADTRRAWRPWLVRVATHLSIDALRRRRRRGYVGPWLPTPIDDEALEGWEPSAATETVPDAAARYELLESTSFAFLLALEALGPSQRAALILMDVLGHSAREAAEVLGTSEGNARVLRHRARRLLAAYEAGAAGRRRATSEAVREVLSSLVRCLATRDVEGLEGLLSRDVRALTDGGGEYTALYTQRVGRRAVARLLLRVAERRIDGARIRSVVANAAPALLVEFATTVRRQAPRLLLRIELDAAGRVSELHAVLASRKLQPIVDALR